MTLSMVNKGYYISFGSYVHYTNTYIIRMCIMYKEAKEKSRRTSVCMTDDFCSITSSAVCVNPIVISSVTLVCITNFMLAC